MNCLDRPLTPEEFKNEMMKIRHEKYDIQDDEEVAHICMDQLILYLLISLGYREGVEIFIDTPKWYA